MPKHKRTLDLDVRTTPQIGRALVSTHDYRRAVEYYRKALRGQPRSIPLRHDLARLCLKLSRFEDASAVLRQVRVMLLLLVDGKRDAFTIGKRGFSMTASRYVADRSRHGQPSAHERVLGPQFVAVH